MVTSDASQAWKDLLNTPRNDALVLSDKERLALDLFHQEQELRLQRSLIEAHHSEPQPDTLDGSSDQLEEQLRTAEREALEARAVWMLRNKIVQHAIVTDPALKAVHAGENASATERRLFPLLNERDVLMMVHGSLAAKELSNWSALSSAETATAAANTENRKLAQQLLQLADEIKPPKAEDITDAKLLGQLQTLEAETREARRRWRVMKSAVAGIIAGSGVDWERDEKLRDLILDEEDELG